MQRAADRTSTESIKKPRGGYRMISVPQICLIWRAYKSKLLPKFYDVRVYFALHEVDERRAAENRTRRRRGLGARRFALDRGKLMAELHELLEGLNPRLISASLRRLQRSGIVDITRQSIQFAQRPCELQDAELDGFDRMLRRIDRRETVHGRGVPVPRRMMRFLARESTQGVAATLLAHAMRCLWLHRSAYRFVGTCPTRFVAEVFETNRRTVIRARQYLSSSAVRWLVPLVTAPHIHQRYGSRFAINPRWERPARTLTSQQSVPRATRRTPSGPVAPVFLPLRKRSELSPRGAVDATEMSPDIETKNPLTEVQQPRTARCARPGVCEHENRQQPASLDRIAPADLRCTASLEELLIQAQRRGWLGSAVADRLAFFAAAEHALRVGTRNPPGLFLTMLRRELWAYVTQADEDAARRKLIAVEHGPSVSRPNKKALDSRGVLHPRRISNTRSPTPVEQLVSELARSCCLGPSVAEPVCSARNQSISRNKVA